MRNENYCGICGKHRNTHVGRVKGCFGGYGTTFNPNGKRDERVWPVPPTIAEMSGSIDFSASSEEPLLPARARAVAERFLNGLASRWKGRDVHHAHLAKMEISNLAKLLDAYARESKENR